MARSQIESSVTSRSTPFNAPRNHPSKWLFTKDAARFIIEASATSSMQNEDGTWWIETEGLSFPGLNTRTESRIEVVEVDNALRISVIESRMIAEGPEKLVSIFHASQEGTSLKSTNIIRVTDASDNVRDSNEGDKHEGQWAMSHVVESTASIHLEMESFPKWVPFMHRMLSGALSSKLKGTTAQLVEDIRQVIKIVLFGTTQSFIGLRMPLHITSFFS